MAKFVLGAAILATAMAQGAPVCAADEDAKATFLGQSITAQPGLHMAMKDINVRSKPNLSAKKIGLLNKGRKITVAGYADSWLAVIKDGKDFGFVYAPITLPLIDGTLRKDIRGRGATADGVGCDYNIHFEGKSEMRDVPVETADYEVWFRCDYAHGGGELMFPTIMFITEAPYQLERKGAFQITLDVPDLAGDEYEQLFSSNLLYHRNKKVVAYDGATLKRFVTAPTKKEIAADTTRAALGAGVEVVLSSWTKATLGAIAKKR